MTEVDDALKLLKEKRITIEHRDKFQIWGGNRSKQYGEVY